MALCGFSVVPDNKWFACRHLNPAQGDLLLVAMQLMMGGSLRAALVDPERRDMLHWSNR